MADFEIAYGETELREGGYVNDPVDRGGETCRGVARKFHPNWEGWELVDQIKTQHPEDFKKRIDEDPVIAERAKEFYRKQFWNPIQGDQLPNQHLANKVFDTAVNQGIGTSLRYLQEGLNLLNRSAKDYPDIPVDGRMGLATLATIHEFLKLEKDKPDYLLKLLNLMQAFRYVEIMRADSTQERFARGWLNRVDLR